MANQTLSGNITIGVHAETDRTMAVDLENNILYTVDEMNDTLSAIDTKTNKVVAGVKFNVNPFNAGQYEKLRKQDAQKQQEMMRQIIESRKARLAKIN